MSTFAVVARHITLHPIENADRLELARPVGTEFVAVVQKGLHRDGDLIVYIPEQAILPDEIIAEMGLVSEDGKTMLAGGTVLPDGTKKRDRVKALKLRGQLSQGLIYSHTDKLGELVEGDDYAEALGITKYQPPIPVALAGQVEAAPGLRSYTDIENIKYYPEVFTAGETVVATEKLHGTCSIFSLRDGELVVSSKGLAGKQLSIKHDEGNAYWRMAAKYGLREALEAIAARYPDAAEVTVFGETVGVQDLAYGLPKGDLDFRLFDVRVDDRYVDVADFREIAQLTGLPTVPVLYEGPFDRAAIEEVATGREQFSGKEANIREGVVVKPLVERFDPALGRVILKVISPKYLLRKGDATEYE